MSLYVQIMIMVLLGLITIVRANYQCVCSSDGARQVFEKSDTSSPVIGFLFQFQCRKMLYPVDENWNAIVFMHQVGYIRSNISMIQNCIGEPTDTFTTSMPPDIKTTLTTTMTPVTTTTPAPTTTTTPAPTTSTPTNTVTQAYVIPEGHLDLCPQQVRHDLNIFNGFLGQFGEYCYEFVNVTTQWHNADRHCKVADNGDLIDIVNKEQQNFFIRFLTRNRVADPIWLGLTDSEREGATAEGQWTWISGKSVTYTNFGPDYNSHSSNTHKLDNCVIMKPGGEWTDVPCGVALLLGTGFGEQHKFICQYNVTSKPADLFSFFPHEIFGK